MRAQLLLERARNRMSVDQDGNVGAFPESGSHEQRPGETERRSSEAAKQPRQSAHAAPLAAAGVAGYQANGLGSSPLPSRSSALLTAQVGELEALVNKRRKDVLVRLGVEVSRLGDQAPPTPQGGAFYLRSPRISCSSETLLAEPTHHRPVSAHGDSADQHVFGFGGGGADDLGGVGQPHSPAQPGSARLSLKHRASNACFRRSAYFSNVRKQSVATMSKGKPNFAFFERQRSVRAQAAALCTRCMEQAVCRLVAAADAADGQPLVPAVRPVADQRVLPPASVWPHRALAALRWVPFLASCRQPGPSLVPVARAAGPLQDASRRKQHHNLSTIEIGGKSKRRRSDELLGSDEEHLGSTLSSKLTSRPFRFGIKQLAVPTRGRVAELREAFQIAVAEAKDVQAKALVAKTDVENLNAALEQVKEQQQAQLRQLGQHLVPPYQQLDHHSVILHRSSPRDGHPAPCDIGGTTIQSPPSITKFARPVRFSPRQRRGDGAASGATVCEFPQATAAGATAAKAATASAANTVAVAAATAAMNTADVTRVADLRARREQLRQMEAYLNAALADVDLQNQRLLAELQKRDLQGRRRQDVALDEVLERVKLCHVGGSPLEPPCDLQGCRTVADVATRCAKALGLDQRSSEVKLMLDTCVIEDVPSIVAISGAGLRVDGFYGRRDVIYNGKPTWHRHGDKDTWLLCTDPGPAGTWDVVDAEMKRTGVFGSFLQSVERGLASPVHVARQGAGWRVWQPKTGGTGGSSAWEVTFSVTVHAQGSMLLTDMISGFSSAQTSAYPRSGAFPAHKASTENEAPELTVLILERSSKGSVKQAEEDAITQPRGDTGLTGDGRPLTQMKPRRQAARQAPVSQTPHAFRPLQRLPQASPRMVPPLASPRTTSSRGGRHRDAGAATNGTFPAAGVAPLADSTATQAPASAPAASVHARAATVLPVLPTTAGSSPDSVTYQWRQS